MKSVKNFILIIIVILLIVFIGFGFKKLSIKKDDGSSSTSTEATTEQNTTETTEDPQSDTDDNNDTDDGDDKDVISTETDATETTASKGDGDKVTQESAEDKNDEVSKRYKKRLDELFHVTLIFFDEYNYDSDFFKVKKAMLVQNESHDYMYFQYTYKDTTKWTCYDYDGHYFREESQSVFKDEYSKGLASYEDKQKTQDRSNTYYPYKKSEIKKVNDMY
ncbi:MAG: hypothetical protein MJ087_03050 [Lachnospiraceae bacterium]|nr:hypothetical protein [Lachnospiraceae bacterium]